MSPRAKRVRHGTPPPEVLAQVDAMHRRLESEPNCVEFVHDSDGRLIIELSGLHGTRRLRPAEVLDLLH